MKQPVASAGPLARSPAGSRGARVLLRDRLTRRGHAEAGEFMAVAGNATRHAWRRPRFLDQEDRSARNVVSVGHDRDVETGLGGRCGPRSRSHQGHGVYHSAEDRGAFPRGRTRTGCVRPGRGDGPKRDVTRRGTVRQRVRPSGADAGRGGERRAEDHAVKSARLGSDRLAERHARQRCGGCSSPLAMTVIATAKFAHEMNADDRGRFSLDIPSVASPWVGMIGTGMLWAYRPGSLVATIPVYQGAIPPGLPLRLVTGPPAGAIFEVRDPDGKPVVGAKIEPQALEARLGPRAGSPRGPHRGRDRYRRPRPRLYGRFLPRGGPLDPRHRGGVWLAGVRFRSPGADTGAETSPAPARRPAQGRLIGDADAIRRCPLSVVEFSPPDDPVQSSHMHYVTTDDDGRFDIPAAAVGPHGVRTLGALRFSLVGTVGGVRGRQGRSNGRGRRSFEASGPGPWHRP